MNNNVCSGVDGEPNSNGNSVNLSSGFVTSKRKGDAEARKIALAAWSLIALVFLAAIASFINQTIQIFQALGWIAKP